MTAQSLSFEREIILNEIAGKNAAIHAYDRIGWQIRTGFLTLLFLGWGIILKSQAGEGGLNDAPGMQSLIFRMFVISSGLTLGGWFIDLSYLRHKFRVVLALNELVAAIWTAGESLKDVPVELLKVAGDRSERPYDSRGYREARRTGICVFWIPLATIGIVSLALH